MFSASGSNYYELFILSLNMADEAWNKYQSSCESKI